MYVYNVITKKDIENIINNVLCEKNANVLLKFKNDDIYLDMSKHCYIKQQTKNNIKQQTKYHKCKKSCCLLEYISNYIRPYGPWLNDVKKTRAGVIIYNTTHNTVLLIQSAGYKWGLPKGRMEKNEDPLDTAIRELSEETGILLDKADLASKECIKINSSYCFIYKTDNTVIYKKKFLEKNVYNDVTGIGYISLDCLKNDISLWNKLTITSKKLINYLINS